jgi:phage tail-like protein
MAVGDRIDPYRSFNYRIEINGTQVAGFNEANVGAFDVEPVEYREGIDPMYPRKLSALRKFANIVLKRGYTDNNELQDWYALALNGTVLRRDGAIILQDEDRNEVVRWNFAEGWPCKYESAALNATSNDVAIESVELCVERVEVVFLNA